MWPFYLIGCMFEAMTISFNSGRLKTTNFRLKLMAAIKRFERKRALKKSGSPTAADFHTTPQDHESGVCRAGGKVEEVSAAEKVMRQAIGSLDLREQEIYGQLCNGVELSIREIINAWIGKGVPTYDQASKMMWRMRHLKIVTRIPHGRSNKYKWLLTDKHQKRVWGRHER